MRADDTDTIRWARLPWFLRDARAAYRARRLERATQGGMVVPRAPAFDPETDRWFRARLATVRRYAEYGTGASTLLAGATGVPGVAVESDARFAAAVRAALPAGAGIAVVHADIGRTAEWGYPVRTRLTPARRHAWRGYVEAGLAAFAGGAAPDLVLIDGRFRVACALAVARAAGLAGARTDILFDDYSGRAHYGRIEEALGPPTMIGRAALFVVARPAITEAMIARAATDPR